MPIAQPHTVPPEMVGSFARVNTHFFIAVVVVGRVFVSVCQTGRLHVGDGGVKPDVKLIFSFAQAVLHGHAVSDKHVLCMQYLRTVEKNIGMGIQSFKKEHGIVVFQLVVGNRERF